MCWVNNCFDYFTSIKSKIRCFIMFSIRRRQYVHNEKKNTYNFIRIFQPHSIDGRLDHNARYAIHKSKQLKTKKLTEEKKNPENHISIDIIDLVRKEKCIVHIAFIVLASCVALLIVNVMRSINAYSVSNRQH